MAATTTYGIQSKASFRSRISRGACSACVVARRSSLLELCSRFCQFSLIALLAIIFAACGHDDLVMPDVDPVEEVPPYVEIRIAVPYVNSFTRGNPMGGEEGNGREPGVLNEDKIHDINVFFYIEDKDSATGKGLGLDSGDDTQIIKHIFYNLKDPSDVHNTKLVTLTEGEDQDASQDISQGYLSLKFDCTQEELDKAKKVGINFVAIANVGPLQYTEGMKMKSLRGMRLTSGMSGSWTNYMDAMSKDAAKMDYFLMSTAYNSDPRCGTNKIVSDGENYTGTTTLQRLYARIDLWYNKEKNAVTQNAADDKIQELKYAVKEAEDNNVYVTNVLPVNIMRDPSYLFKKVTNENDGWESDRTIWNKSSLDLVSKFSWGGKESPNDTPISSPDRPKNYVMEWHTTSKKPGGDSPKDSLNAWYGSTAVEKVKINILAGNSNADTDGHFSTYYHSPKDAGAYDPADYDCNHISIISYANENTHPTDCFHSNYLTGLAFRAVYVPAKIYKGYESISEGENAEGKLIEWTQGDAEPTAIYRYSPSAEKVKESEALYFSDMDALESYHKDHLADSPLITEFAAAREPVNNSLGFTCYYNLWLRHYNDGNADPQLTYPMEYATVRNNIYRVKISFSGPGDPTPTMREPDTMQARLYVIKWNFRKQPEIAM